MTEPVSAASDERRALLPPTDLGLLDRSLLSSIAWTAAAKWIAQTLSWAGTLVVVRLLDPTDYGIMGMATAFLALLQPLCDFGIAAAIVQGRDLSETHIARLNGFAIGLGIACAVVVAALSFPIAAFFGDDRLIAIVRVLGAGFLLGALRVVPTALLAREMRFRALALLETAEALTGIATTISLAATGHGYWSLVLGPLVARAVGSALAMTTRPFTIGNPLPIGRIRGTVRFGAWVTISTLAWYAYSSSDRVIVGRLVGEAALGAYSISLTIASMPIDKIGELYQRVAGSVISRVQHDAAAIGRYMLRITEGVAMLSFPASAGLALVADLFVDVVLGAQWRAAVVPLRVLAAAAAIRSLDPLLAQVLVATGHAKQNARSMILAAITLPIAFLIGSTGGVAGVAAVWLIGHPLVIMTQQIRKTIAVADITLRDYLAALRPATTGTLFMAAAVGGTRMLVGHRMSAAPSLALLIAIGAATYVLSLVSFFPQRLSAARAFIRRR